MLRAIYKPTHAKFGAVDLYGTHAALEISRVDTMSRSAASCFRLPSEPEAYFELTGERVSWPSGLRWTCTRCTNSCCDLPGRKRKILLTARDVERIAITTRHDQKEFSYAVEGRSPYERRMKMILGKCVFLKGPKCSIYRIRPIICRFYPFSLTPSVGGGLRIAFDPACSGIGKGVARDEKFFTNLVRLASRELSE